MRMALPPHRRRVYAGADMTRQTRLLLILLSCLLAGLVHGGADGGETRGVACPRAISAPRAARGHPAHDPPVLSRSGRYFPDFSFTRIASFPSKNFFVFGLLANFSRSLPSASSNSFASFSLSA